MSDKKTAVIYTRVSTMRQANEGVSLAAQLAKAQVYCNALGYEVVAHFEDAGISGQKIKNRPGLNSALETACQHGAAIVVDDISRLARSTMEGLTIAEHLGKSGVELLSMSEAIDLTTASGKFAFRMKVVMAEYERDRISERTTAALAYKRSQGYKLGGHSAPYGFDVTSDGKLIKNATEQKTIGLISRLRNKGYTLQAIAGTLKAKGIQSKTGKLWSATTVSRVLKQAAATA